MASSTSAPAIPEAAVATNPDVAASPGGVSSGSTTSSPNVSAFLSQFRAASGADGPDINDQLKRKRDERAEHKKEAQKMAKDLSKLRNQKARSAQQTRGATTDDLLQALSDRAALTARKEAEEKAKRDLEPDPWVVD